MSCFQFSITHTGLCPPASPHTPQRGDVFPAPRRLQGAGRPVGKPGGGGGRSYVDYSLMTITDDEANLRKLRLRLGPCNKVTGDKHIVCDAPRALGIQNFRTQGAHHSTHEKKAGSPYREHVNASKEDPVVSMSTPSGKAQPPQDASPVCPCRCPRCPRGSPRPCVVGEGFRIPGVEEIGYFCFLLPQFSLSLTRC